MDKKKKTLIILDSNSLVHRAFHALPPFTSTKGELVNAVYGFMLVFFKIVKDMKPDYIAATFDVAGPTFRHKQFAEYKANRAEAPNELYAQIPMIKELLKKLGVPIFEKQGFEADDLIGVLAVKAAAKKGINTVIVSGDMDNLQLVNDTTRVYTLKKGIKDTVLYDEEMVKEKYGGLSPKQLVEFKGLAGDASDNIPGVKGVGEKTAIQLLQEYPTLEKVYTAVEKGKADITEKMAEKILSAKEQAFMSRDLGRIKTDVPLEVRFEDLMWGNFDEKEIQQAFKEYGFNSLVARIGELTGKPIKEQQEMFGPPQSSEEKTQEDIERLYKEKVFSKEIYELEKNLTPILRAMEKAGIAIDLPYFAKLEKEFAKELQKLEKRIHTTAKKEFNINSPKQLADVLFKDLGLSTKGIKKTPGGALSTASSELEKLESSHKIISDILLYRELNKLYTTYIVPLPQLVDGKGRIHTTFDQLGAATGRLSSSKPNLQQIPNQGDWGKKIRRGFIAGKGKSLVSFDYSQVELRIAAHVAGDENMIAAFKQGVDIHAATAAQVFGVDTDRVTPDMRFRAKALNFGILYGMGPQGFAKSAGITIDEARDFIKNYFAMFPAIHEYIETTKAFARVNGYTETMFGRKRYIPDIRSTTPFLRAAAERIAINTPIQGGAADIMKMAMIEVAKEVNKKAVMLLQIHDELVFEMPDDIIPKQASVIIDIMENVVPLAVTLEVKAQAGKNWGSLAVIV